MGPIGALLDLVVPSSCWACGARAREREPLCLACRAGLRWLDADPIELAGVKVWAPLAYDGGARDLVRGLKFRGAAGLAQPMAAQIAACAPPRLLRPPALLVPPACWACGARARRHEPLCLACRAALHWLDDEPVELAGVATWAPVAYDGPARALVGGLKFRGAVGLAAPMAAQIAACAPPRVLRPPAVLVPVPLHPARARARGYNQAERLAAELAARTGLRVSDCLRRHAGGGRQVGRGRGERLAAVAGAVRCRAGADVPERALLIDDVVTTGGTLAACADALYRGGAVDVAAVAYARTPGR